MFRQPEALKLPYGLIRGEAETLGCMPSDYGFCCQARSSADGFSDTGMAAARVSVVTSWRPSPRTSRRHRHIHLGWRLSTSIAVSLTIAAAITPSTATIATAPSTASSYLVTPPPVLPGMSAPITSTLTFLAPAAATHARMPGCGLARGGGFQDMFRYATAPAQAVRAPQAATSAGAALASAGLQPAAGLGDEAVQVARGAVLVRSRT